MSERSQKLLVRSGTFLPFVPGLGLRPAHLKRKYHAAAGKLAPE
jgi:hypothetical protein